MRTRTVLVMSLAGVLGLAAALSLASCGDPPCGATCAGASSTGSRH